MKIIDILVKKANETLEDGFKFCYKYKIYIYNKKDKAIYEGDSFAELGENYKLERCLNDEVLLFKETNKVNEEDKNIEEIPFFDDISNYDNHDIEINRAKINELVRAVNKIREEK